jgi:hypothetical protein
MMPWLQTSCWVGVFGIICLKSQNRHATISSDQYSASSHSQARSKDGSAACSSSSALQQPMHLPAPQLVGIRLPGLLAGMANEGPLTSGVAADVCNKAPVGHADT